MKITERLVCRGCSQAYADCKCADVSESARTAGYKPVYTVHAYRFGDREMHSYPVGVFTTISEAKAAKADEEIDRGGKYLCEIYEWRANRGRNKDFKTISPLDSGIDV